MSMQMSLMVDASTNWMHLQRCLALWCQDLRVGFLMRKPLLWVEVAAPESTALQDRRLLLSH